MTTTRQLQVVGDPTEHEDVAAAQPAIVARMLAQVGALNEGVFEGAGPAGVTDEQVCAVSARTGGVLTPSDWRAEL
jgi:hypothetical protein